MERIASRNERVTLLFGHLLMPESSQRKLLISSRYPSGQFTSLLIRLLFERITFMGITLYMETY